MYFISKCPVYDGTLPRQHVANLANPSVKKKIRYMNEKYDFVLNKPKQKTAL